MSRRRRVAHTGVLGAVLLAGIVLSPRSHLPARAQTSAEVDMLGNQLTPADLTVTAGTVVTWVNQEDQPGGTGALHTIVSLADLTPIAPNPLAPGDSFALAYDTPGVFYYYCTLHTYMVGSITVQ